MRVAPAVVLEAVAWGTAGRGDWATTTSGSYEPACTTGSGEARHLLGGFCALVWDEMWEKGKRAFLDTLGTPSLGMMYLH